MKGSLEDQLVLRKWARCTIREGHYSHRTGTHTTQQGSKVTLKDKAKVLHLRS